MNSLLALKLLIPLSSLMGGSLLAQKLCPCFSNYWWLAFSISSIVLWITTHIVVDKYITVVASHK